MTAIDQSPRKIHKRRKTAEDREQEIINATIAVIGTKGLSKTTLADIAKKAGVGYGNLTFRFATKDKLLVAAPSAVLDEYSEVMEAAAAAKVPARERLDGLVAAAFDPAVTTRNKIALWNSFLSECHTRPAYRRIFEELREREANRTLDVCKEIIAEASLDGLDAEAVALGINALVEGLWFNMRLGGVIDRQTALHTVRMFISRIMRN